MNPLDILCMKPRGFGTVTRLILNSCFSLFPSRSLHSRLEEDEAATDARLTLSNTGIVIARS